MFCLLAAVVTVVFAGLGWSISSLWWGWSPLPAVAFSIVLVFLGWWLYSKVARMAAARRHQRTLEALSEVDETGRPVHLEEQKARIQNLTGVAVGMLLPPQEVAAASDTDLVGGVVVADSLLAAARDFQQCFAQVDEAASEQAAASSDVGRQLRELNGGELAERGWSQRKISRAAKMMAVRKVMGSRPPG